ncbi:MAG TPA: hypothetical protein VGM91_17005 [Conexibacter sp.]|jgi:hypothetical protein
MSLDLALQRISQIQAMIAPLDGGASASSSPDPTTSASTTSASTPLAMAASAALVPAAGAASSAALPQTSFANVLAGTTGTLSPKAASSLTAGQQAFVTQLAAQTGLNPQVVAAWALSEESSGAAATREGAHNNDWLNIGYTDSGTFGAGASVWNDPISAANATAGWLKGQDTIDGYGTASAGVQSILQTAGQSPEAQVAALQRSGWASSGYPDLPGLLRQIS